MMAYSLLTMPNLWLEPGFTLALFAIGTTTAIILWLKHKTRQLVFNKKNGQYQRRSRPMETNRKKPSRCQGPTISPKPHLPSNLKCRKKLTFEQPTENNDINIHSEDLNACQIRPEEPDHRSIHLGPTVNAWIHESKNAPRCIPSDTEDSLASSSSSGKMSRRQKKNKKRRKRPVENYECYPNSEYGTNFLFERLQMTEQELHATLLELCVGVEDRILNGYPYATDQGTFIFKRQGYSSVTTALRGHTLLEEETNDLKSASDNDTSDSSEEVGAPIYIGPKIPQKSPSPWRDFNINYKEEFHLTGLNLGLSSFRTCIRCQAPFCVSNNGREPCLYHPNKARLIGRQLEYQCCTGKKDTGLGCTYSEYHVFHQVYFGLNGPLHGFASTLCKQRNPRVIAIDCEMVYTSEGFEIAKVSLVNHMGKILLDTFVKPAGLIYDYNTKYSGINKGDLNNAVSFKALQEKLLNIISKTDILVGHSLESDLSVLKLIHRRVLDTSLLFKEGTKVKDQNGGTPVTRRLSLKDLVKKHLGKDIQTDSGHCSLEDSAFTLNLVLWHLWENRPLGKSQKVAPLPLVLQAFS